MAEAAQAKMTEEAEDNEAVLKEEIQNQSETIKNLKAELEQKAADDKALKQKLTNLEEQLKAAQSQTIAEATTAAATEAVPPKMMMDAAPPAAASAIAGAEVDA